MKTRISILATLTVALLVTTMSATGQTKPPLRIGGLLSLSGAGAPNGQVAATGAKMAVKEINENGGIDGRQVELILADDQNDPAQAVNEVRRLVQRERIQFLVGPVNSSIVLATFPVLTEAKVASIAYAGSTAITPQAGPLGFTTSPPSDAQAEAMISYAKNALKSSAIGVLADNGAYSKGWVEEVRKHAAKYGARIVATQEFALGSSDMVPQLLSLRRSNPDVILLSVVTGADLGHVQQGLQQINWNVKLLGNTAMSAFIGSAKEITGPDAFKNSYGLQLTSFTYCPADNPDSSPVPKFINAAKAFDPAQFSHGGGNVPAAGAMYDAVHIFKAAVEANAGKTDGPSIAKWIEQSSKNLKNLVSGVPEPSATSHFIFGAKSLAMVEQIDKVRADGLSKRASCN